MRLLRSALAAVMSSGSVSALTPNPAIALAACTIALWAAGLLPCATTCQVWKGVPIATVGACTWTVGTTQLTSPTSVEPICGSRLAFIRHDEIGQRPVGRVHADRAIDGGDVL